MGGPYTTRATETRMNLRERIARRQRTENEPKLIRDYDAVSPVAHPDEPTGRGPMLERLLDHLDPTFDGALPENAYVWGPKGAGKSAVVSALFDHLSAFTLRSRSPILTTTRAERPSVVEFVYVDAHVAKSDFGLYHAVVDGLVDEPIPEQGVGTGQLRSKLHDYLNHGSRVVVAVDHVAEPETYPPSAVADLFEPYESLSWLAVGRVSPDRLGDAPAAGIEFTAYRRHALTDILTTRVSDGLTHHALSHEQIRTLVEWADGDAHDALAAVFGAADRAMHDGEDRVSPADLEHAIDDVPRPCASLGRVLALPENRQRVLLSLLDLDDDRRRSVSAAAEAVADSGRVDLSETTVKRILYELSEAGITRRVTVTDAAGQGRPPSRLEPRFPTYVFRRLSDCESR